MPAIVIGAAPSANETLFSTACVHTRLIEGVPPA